MIAVAVRLVARPEMREELIRRLRDEMFGPCRQEAGCIKYHFYQDVENPNAFSLVEEWEDWDAINDHFRSDHVGHFLAGLPDVLSEPPEARFYEVSRTKGLEAIEEARSSGH